MSGERGTHSRIELCKGQCLQTYSLLSKYLYLLFSHQHLYIVKNMCIHTHTHTHTHTSDCVQTVYELPFLPNNTASETFLRKSGAVRSVDWLRIGTGGGHL